MKIKFSRQQSTLEISRFVPSTQKRGLGEWTSKSETIMQEQLGHGDIFIQKLTVEERLGLDYIIKGLKLVEAAEEVYKITDRHGVGEDPTAKTCPDLESPDINVPKPSWIS
jgi:hypothetical protein